jgi:TonB family protein
MPNQTRYHAETTGWGASFTTSLLLHSLVFVGLIGWAYYQRAFRMGEQDGKPGGAVGVTMVKSIPIPQDPAPEIKRAARDTPNEVLEKPEPKKVEQRLDEGIALLKKKKKEKKLDLRAQADKYRLPEEKIPDRLASNMGTRARSEMYKVAGSGEVGIGNNNPFGDGLGWYAKRLQEHIGSKWNTDDVPRLSGGRTSITFTIFRNGTVANGKVVQSSGNPAADRAALRAIEAANPFIPLPANFPRDAAFVEYQFDIRR